MKKKLYIVLTVCALFCSSCEDWLTQEDSTAMNTNDVYSSVENISSVIANLYSSKEFRISDPIHPECLLVPRCT